MRRTAILALFLSLAALPALGAEDPFGADIEALRVRIREGREAVVQQALPLTDEEAKAFWPLYLEHQAALDEVRDERLRLVLDFFEHAATMTDDDARAMLGRMFDIKAKLVDVDRAWSKRFLAVLPARKVGRYFQIESKIDAVLAEELAALVPLTPPEAVPTTDAGAAGGGK